MGVSCAAGGLAPLSGVAGEMRKRAGKQKQEPANGQALVDIGVSQLIGCYTLNGEVGG